MGQLVVRFKGQQVEISKLLCFSVPEYRYQTLFSMHP